MRCCFLKGLQGDEINAVLTAAGSNLQKLLRAIAPAQILWLWCVFTGGIFGIQAGPQLAAGSQ